ncbi:MAG: tetratricopeptide repeat protein, partial [Bacteroidetes bacterium]|nr:tetratricopeptide repeat protein [Bacteroidota bacterium]
MKLKIIILVLGFSFGVLRAQTYEKDWEALNKKMESGVSVPVKEMEAFNLKYKDKLPLYPDNTMQLYSSIAINYYNQNDLVKTEQNYLKAYEYSKTAKDTLLKPVAEYYLATFYHNQDNYLEAEQYYLKCMYGMSVVYGQSSREYTQIFLNYTSLLVSLEKHQQAQPYIEALLYYYKTLDGVGNSNYIRLLNYQAIIYQSKGEYAKAIDILSAIVEEKSLLKLGDTASYVTIQLNLGDVYRETGKYDLAIMNLKKARQNYFAYKLKDRGALATIENNLGVCYKGINSTK